MDGLTPLVKDGRSGATPLVKRGKSVVQIGCTLFPANPCYKFHQAERDCRRDIGENKHSLVPFMTTTPKNDDLTCDNMIYQGMGIITTPDTR